MDPQQALLPSGAAAIYGVVMSGGTLDIHTIDSANTILGDADYAPPASFASFASSPNGVRVVVENAGACETFAIAGNGTTGARHVFSPCFEPRLAAIGTSGFVLYRTVTGGALTLHRIPQDAAQAGETIPLEIGTNPRIATIDGAIWVAYLGSNGQARLVRVDGETLTMRDDPSIVSSFDLLPSGVFWVTPTGAIHTGTPCL